MKIIKYINAAIAVFIAVKRLVEEFERPGHGAEKKEAVLKTIEVFYDITKEYLPLTKEQVLELADKLIDVIVGFYNIIGLFKHGTPGTPTAPAN